MTISILKEPKKKRMFVLEDGDILYRSESLAKVLAEAERRGVEVGVVGFVEYTERIR
jgi:hypothetical protein